MQFATKWLEMVVKRPFRPVANLMHHPLGYEEALWLKKLARNGRKTYQSMHIQNSEKKP